ncbi:hypothetical protein CLIB1423_19S01332 [[Candida] railenensis]|uniref:FAM192A/Fyv6 N-terminal domain-containing protein n=1 Tax=[Candida] railenensis TaxID=45579 RepID=A0A9P0QUJ1_9ASCO|nr:hypothetical protein CLIB1423_19S01332 [[Candida] railenensis]
MPDFVKENSQGDAEVQSQILKEREVVANQIAEEDESERKTLYEQLQESRAQKSEKFSQLVSSRNSSYKLDEKSAQFYNELKEREMAKESRDKDFEKLEVERFRIQKAKAKAQRKGSGSDEAPLSATVPLTQKVAATATEAILNGDESIIKIRKKRLPEAKKFQNREKRTQQEEKPVEPKKASILPGIDDYSTSEEDD